VVVDGGSRDGTLDLLMQFAATRPHVLVVEEPGCNISRGRNLAIQQATSDIIAVTDGGVVLPRHWLAEITRPLLERPEVDVVAGFFRPHPRTPFEQALGAATLPLASEVKPDTFIPSSRSVAFRRSWWEKVGGYPEWLDYCEDVVFDLRLRKAGACFVFQPAATVLFRPRSTLRSFFLQYYRYARGDGKAGLWPERHAIRYSAYLTGLLMLWKGIKQPLWWLVLLLGLAAALHRPFVRALTDPARGHLLQTSLLLSRIAVIRIVGDVAKMIGYPVGVWWRWRQRLRGSPSLW